MRFSVAVILSALAAAVAAQSNDNPFKYPTGGWGFKAGSSTEIDWDPTTSGTVTILLREGANSNLSPGTAIAKSIPNNGKFTWAVPADTVRGANYALEIVDDQDSSKTNYSPQFVIDSTVIASSSSSSSASASSTSASASSSSASAASSSSSASSSASSSSASSSSTSSASSSKSSHASSTLSSATKSSATAAQTSSHTAAPTNGAIARQASIAAPVAAVLLAAVAL
ncbi:hypothetical protein L228DRAFT_238310 [Xylona heveae TC161]|uniref:Yeast cell wall synthesis Kre9/Knh1-like N-terminal domain-containing protein n=1 Tax=Xylona heveae (strain CBS 132557 / TC161) TaxID=1328760 RepID=A0A165HP40_XYLHT|nr:hypothetical protein L228DRAFT_238310 [Xylona heveae TC161]KZF23791.1 hypothetical protein L228DRAFT_238310 [Xylona heveae TC161]